jgi:hypothetical protein
MKFLGYVYDAFGHYKAPQTLEDEFALVKFINEYLEAPQMVVTDLNDNQLLLTREGVDFYSNLSSLGIELGDVYRQIREDQPDSEDDSHQKPPWEALYDSIGLSPSEVRMRQNVKQSCLAAKTVKDVAELLKETYFSVYFYNQKRDKCWGHLDVENLIAELLLQDGEGYWYDTGSQVKLEGESRVHHLRSSEDIHEFLLLDTPTSLEKML